MKPVSQEIITMLIEDWKGEISAYLQYTAHYIILDNFGYKKFAQYVKDRADEELNDHAILLSKRIAFLEGKPPANDPDPAKVAYEFITDKNKVYDLLKNDFDAEKKGIERYRKHITRAEELGDFETANILRDILGDEERHANEIEEHTDQLGHMGVQVFLGTQV